jgi:DDE superfamily endonuclease
VAQVLAPTLRPGDLAVLDNLSTHNTAYIREGIENHGTQVIDLPPHSPDLSPIEQWWSKVKTFLCRAQARTREAEAGQSRLTNAREGHQQLPLVLGIGGIARNGSESHALSARSGRLPCGYSWCVGVHSARRL